MTVGVELKRKNVAAASVLFFEGYQIQGTFPISHIGGGRGRKNHQYHLPYSGRRRVWQLGSERSWDTFAALHTLLPGQACPSGAPEGRQGYALALNPKQTCAGIAGEAYYGHPFFLY